MHPLYAYVHCIVSISSFKLKRQMASNFKIINSYSDLIGPTKMENKKQRDN